MNRRNWPSSRPMGAGPMVWLRRRRRARGVSSALVAIILLVLAIAATMGVLAYGAASASISPQYRPPLEIRVAVNATSGWVNVTDTGGWTVHVQSIVLVSPSGGVKVYPFSAELFPAETVHLYVPNLAAYSQVSVETDLGSETAPVG